MIKERLTQGWVLKHQPGAEMLADLGTKPLASGRFLELMLGLGLHVPPSVVARPQARAVSLQARFPSLDAETLDLNPVPREARCQSLLRALILLELVGSLPVGESASANVASRVPTAVATWICLAIAVAVVLLWTYRRLPPRTALVSGAMLVGSWFLQNKSCPMPSGWLLAMFLGFGLGWICKGRVKPECKDVGTDAVGAPASLTCRDVGTDAPEPKELLASRPKIFSALSEDLSRVGGPSPSLRAIRG